MNSTTITGSHRSACQCAEKIPFIQNCRFVSQGNNRISAKGSNRKHYLIRVLSESQIKSCLENYYFPQVLIKMDRLYYYYPPDHFFYDLMDIAALVEKAAQTHEDQWMVMAIRWTMQLRNKLNACTVSVFFDCVLFPGSEVHTHFRSNIPACLKEYTPVESATPDTPIPEIEIYCYLLAVIFLVKLEEHVKAKSLCAAGILRIKKHNSHTIDVLAARLYFYYALSYGVAGDSHKIRCTLLASYQTAILRHDKLGQETLLNLLLRNYLDYNLYDQAEKLRSKVPPVEAHSNQQFCRYLFYLGKIRTIQLKYTDAKRCLLQAARIAPISALGFQVPCNRWAVIVRLLLGEIPERTVFMQKGMKKALRPYFELANAVRTGDLELLKRVEEKFRDTFLSDKTSNLIVRLRRNVTRTRIRNIIISYSRISLTDVAKKLRLDSPEANADVESIVAKAIRDGAIDASLDHANGWMISKESGDIYSTNEPQTAFHLRITFCLEMHNKAVRALRFPDSYKENESAEEKRKKQQLQQERAMQIAAEDDGDKFF